MSRRVGETLSDRERAVALACVDGQNYKQIARGLGISPATVRAHLRTIYRKVGVSSKLGLLKALNGDQAPTERCGLIESRTSDPSHRLVVLPFVALGPNSQDAHISDGITEDIATELSRFHQITVLSSGSSSCLRESASPVAEARLMGPHYIVDGSIRWQGDSVRITARLIDATDGKQVWADRFDRAAEEMFAVQDEIVQRIVGTVAGRIEAAWAERSRRKPPSSLDAYECVLRGNALGVGDPAAEAEAGHLFRRAIEIDPGYGLAYSKLAHMLSLAWFREQSDSRATLEEAFHLAKHAVTLDPDEPNTHHVLGWIHLFRRSFDLAERYYRRALELNPNSAQHTSHMGDLNSFLGNADEALRWFEKARHLDPFFEPGHYWRLQGIAHFTANRLDDAIANFRHSPVIPFWTQVYLAACHALCGHGELAADCRNKILIAAPDFSLVRFSTKEPLRREEDTARLVDGMRKAGLPE